MHDAFPDAEVSCISLDALGGGCNKMTEVTMKTKMMMTAVELI